MDHTKANHFTITLGSLALNGVMRPDGSGHIEAYALLPRDAKSCIYPWVEPLPPRGYWFSNFLDLLGQEKEPERAQYLKWTIPRIRGYVAGEFYRLEFDPRSNFSRLPRGRGQKYQYLKSLISEEAELWSKTWKVLENLQSIRRLPNLPDNLFREIDYVARPKSFFRSLEWLSTPPLAFEIEHHSLVSFWLVGLAMESEFLMPYFFDCPVGKKPDGAVRFSSTIQHDNAVLQDFRNPFRKLFAKPFIDIASCTAEQSDLFRKNFYMPMVRQRMKIATRCKQSSARVFDQAGNIARQGRSKEKNDE